VVEVGLFGLPGVFFVLWFLLLQGSVFFPLLGPQSSLFCVWLNV
jgi:hypothetical protein